MDVRIRHLEEGLSSELKPDPSMPITPSNGLQTVFLQSIKSSSVCLVNHKHNHLRTSMVICTAHVSMHTVQCLGGPTGARRPLPPVVLVTHDPMYEEIPDSPPHDQVNCLREECTGQQKVMVEGHSGGMGKVPTHDGNSPLYHTLEPDPHAADDNFSEVVSDYMQPVSSKELAVVDQKLTEIT